MLALVTGGSGYIGSHLVDSLGRAGHAVRVLDVRPPPPGLSPSLAADFVLGSVGDLDAVEGAIQGVDFVYHLAWQHLPARPHPKYSPPDERREVCENIQATLNVLQAARKALVRHFLFAGSAVVYGPTGPRPAEEGDVCHPELCTLGGPVYGITKLACEKLCLLYAARGLPVTVFRLHGVFSQDSLGQFGPMVERALAGEPVIVTRGAGGEYAHVDDVVAAFLLATGNPRTFGEVYNVAGICTYADGELAQVVIEEAGTASQIQWVDDPGQAMVSVGTDKLRRDLGFRHSRGEFLSPLLRSAVGQRGRRVAE